MPIEDDDRPRVWLLAVDRWGMGAEVPELATLTILIAENASKIADVA